MLEGVGPKNADRAIGAHGRGDWIANLAKQKNRPPISEMGRECRFCDVAGTSD